MADLRNYINVDRMVNDVFELVSIKSPTGNTVEVTDRYQQMLEEIGFEVERYEFIPQNPTLVASFGDATKGKTLIFNGHLDVITLQHEEPSIKAGKVYGRGACDMKGSHACFLEVIRALKESNSTPNGRILLIANALHESPGGRGEDLYALLDHTTITADAAVVMEGATYDCTIAQFGSATFEIKIIRDGEPSHQLYTPLGTTHPIDVAAEVIQVLKARNQLLETQWVEDIGYESYFIGRVLSGEFYNQMPKVAVIEGIRRYSDERSFEQIEQEMQQLLQDIAEKNNVQIELKCEKVRDGYKLDKNAPIVHSLVDAVRKVRGIELPLVGKKLVTDAGIFVNGLGIPTVCHGPEQISAHGEVEHVKISELELTAKVYLQLIIDYLGVNQALKKMEA